MQSMYQEDWIMRQIKLLTTAIAKIAFGKDVAVYEILDNTDQSATDELYLYLLRLIGDGKINEAEDLLFQSLNPDNPDMLLLALDFYQRLNTLCDEELEQKNFSRREIHDGLRDVEARYGLSLD